jgi:hypothetical protein
MAIGVASFIGNKDLIGVRQEVNELETIHRLAIGPATREIGGAVNPVVERAGEVKVLGISASIAARSFAT